MKTNLTNQTKDEGRGATDETGHIQTLAVVTGRFTGSAGIPAGRVQPFRSGLRACRRSQREPLSRRLLGGLALGLLLTGCAGPGPLKGGKAVTTRSLAGALQQILVQSDNPSQASKQEQESIKVRTYTIPAGSLVSEGGAVPGGKCQVSGDGVSGGGFGSSAQPATLNHPPGFASSSSASFHPQSCFSLSAPMPVVEREETRTRTELGAAQRDTGREFAAKLSSLKGIVWVGLGLFVFGLASLVYPPLKAIIGSVTTSAALMLGGVALMVLPTLVVGNELLILGVVGLAVGGWFLAHRHGQLRGQVSSLESKVQSLIPSDSGPEL